MSKLLSAEQTLSFFELPREGGGQSNAFLIGANGLAFNG